MKFDQAAPMQTAQGTRDADAHGMAFSETADDVGHASAAISRGCHLQDCQHQGTRPCHDDLHVRMASFRSSCMTSTRPARRPTPGTRTQAR